MIRTGTFRMQHAKIQSIIAQITRRREVKAIADEAEEISDRGNSRGGAGSLRQIR